MYKSKHNIINFAGMRKLWLYLLLLPFQLAGQTESMIAEDFYVSAFNEMSDMLIGRDTLSLIVNEGSSSKSYSIALF